MNKEKIALLAERQAQMKEMRSKKMKLHEIGDFFGVTKERIRQILLFDISKVKTKRSQEDNAVAQKKASRKNTLKRRGVTIEQYNLMYQNQGGKCAICGTTTAGGKGAFHVDHRHADGEIRGLLCHWCNVGIGMFKESADLLLAAKDYLDSTKG